MSERKVTFPQYLNVSAKLLSTSSSREVKALGSALLHLFYHVFLMHPIKDMFYHALHRSSGALMYSCKISTLYATYN